MRWLLVIPLILMGCSAVDRVRDVFRSDAETTRFSTEGSVCGVASIKGEAIGDVPGPGGCGVENAVRITSVGGIMLSQPATLNCGTAKTFDGWVREAAIPIIGTTGGGLRSLKVPAHYACRTRNHKRGARLSEHSKGNAIDISEFHLADGSALSVQGDWGGGRKGRIMKELHASACGRFGTVLGPKSDRYHRDHFHFDIARHRGGPYCR